MRFLKRIVDIILISVLLISLSGLLTGLRVYASSTSDDWPMYGHDSSHTGYSTSTAPNGNTTLWTYTTHDWFSSPSVAYGRLYVFSEGHVYCFNATTGEKIWDSTNVPNLTSPPTIAEGKIYSGTTRQFTTPPYLYDTNVYCLDAFTGATIWNYTTGDRVLSSPVVANGRAYVGSLDDNIYCLDASTSAKIWSYMTLGDIRSSPAVAYGRVYIGSSDHNVYCLNVTTGTKIWNYTSESAASSPIIADGRVYISSGYLYCLNATSGSLMWKSTGSGTAAISGGRVFYNNYGRVSCLNSSSGVSIWNSTISGYNYSGTGPPAVADGKIYICYPAYGFYSAHVSCLNASTGSLIWRFITPDYYYEISYPIIAYGRLYVTLNTRVYDGIIGAVYAFSSEAVAVNKISTTISCKVSSSTITEGNTLTVTGFINPAVSGKTVTLFYTVPSGKITIDRTVTTRSDGSYSDSWKPSTPYYPGSVGGWNVRVVWDGDLEHSGASSQRIVFGVESFNWAVLIPYAVLLAAVSAVSLSAVILYRRRRLRLRSI